jgi:hypothetical protein
MISWKKIIVCGMILSLNMVVLNRGDPKFRVFADSEISNKGNIEDIYQAGAGLPIGKIRSVNGQVVIFHADMTAGYRARTGLPLFKRDTIDALENGRIDCKLSDGTIFSLAPATKIVVDKSLHNSSRKRSRTMISLVHGRAYFHVKPWHEFELREFSVQTDSVVASTEDSNFIITADEMTTIITAMGHGTLMVMNRENQDNQLVLSEFMQAVVEDGVIPTVVETLQDEDIDRLKSEFRFVTQRFPNQ